MSVVREGLLLKKGEFIQTWRPRWFVLRADGSFRGYKQKPVEGDNEVPINVFDVQRSDITTLNPKDEKNIKKGEKYGFSVRFMQLTRIIERSFHTETKEDRDAWVAAYQDVRQKLDRDGAAGSIIERTRAMSFIDPKRPQPCDISLTDFDLLKVLGKGTFGKVMLVRQKSTSNVFAMKVLKKDVVLEKGELVHTLTENSVLAKCSHPFLTSLKYSFQTPVWFYYYCIYLTEYVFVDGLRRSIAYGVVGVLGSNFWFTCEDFSNGPGSSLLCHGVRQWRGGMLTVSTLCTHQHCSSSCIFEKAKCSLRSAFGSTELKSRSPSRTSMTVALSIGT